MLSDVTDCEVSLDFLDGDDSSLDFLSSYLDLAAAATPPPSSSPSQGNSQSYSPQTISTKSTSPSTQTNASHSVSPQQVQARYACEKCGVASGRMNTFAEHYKQCVPTINGYNCGKCRKVFRRRHEFIRHLRSKIHFDESHFCRCGLKFRRGYDFRHHIERGECQGSNVYTCICGHSVQSYADALVLVSIGGHVYKCDDPRSRGRPKKNSSAAASN